MLRGNKGVGMLNFWGIILILCAVGFLFVAIGAITRIAEAIDEIFFLGEWIRESQGLKNRKGE